MIKRITGALCTSMFVVGFAGLLVTCIVKGRGSDIAEFYRNGDLFLVVFSTMCILAIVLCVALAFIAGLRLIWNYYIVEDWRW